MQHQLYMGGRDQEIIQLFKQTFTDSEGASEGELIGALVQQFFTTTKAEDLNVFISVEAHEIIGAVLFSRFRFEHSDKEAWLLSPAAVHTSHQGKGVGQGLIHFAHSFLQSKGVEIVVTYGDINFYSKVGYQPISEDIIKAPQPLSYPEGWIAQSLQGAPLVSIAGETYCVDALNDPVYW